MLAYVTVLSVGMFRISLWLSTMREPLPFVLVLLSPCVRFSLSLPNAVVHTAWVAGSAASFLYFAIVVPVMGWMTAAQYGAVLLFLLDFMSNSCLACRFLTCSLACKLCVNRLSASCVMKRGVWMAIGRVGLVGVSVPWGVLFGMRRGDRRSFLTRSVSGANVASIGAVCCLIPSEVAMQSPSVVGVGGRWDMGRMPGVFAGVTLACVRVAALMLAVDVGLVELYCVEGSCGVVLFVTC